MPEHKLLGNYEIIERVGSGSMGAVFKARQVSMDRIVALKILPPKLAADEAFVQRFLREAQSAGKLGHANLIQVIEVGRAGQYYFYSMEFVGGPTLKQLLEDKGPLDQKTAIDYMTKIAGALAEAHRRGIVHRDVKPDNIILTDQGEPKLADLGLAKPMSGAADVTMGGAAIGTPHYMAPEQSRGEEVDGRADLYALGATFFRMLTGETLFEGPTATAVMVKHSTEQPRKLREVRPDASSGLEAVLAKLLAKNPDDRYPDADALMEDLTAVGAGKLPKHARIAIDSARLKRARAKRREIPTGRQERVAAGAAPQKAGSRATTIAAAAAGFLVVAVGGVLMFTRGGPEPSTDGLERPAGDTRVAPRLAAGKARASGAQSAAAAYAAAEAFARDNPDEFERAIGLYKKARLAGRGTEHEAKAEARAVEIRSAWKTKAREAVGEAVREAKALVGRGDHDGAIARLEGIPASLAPPVEKALRAEISRVRGDAKGGISYGLMGAESLLRKGDLDGARKVLASVEKIKYAELRAAVAARVDTLRLRIEEAEAAKLSAAERLSAAAQAGEARARLDAALAGFESHVKAGQYAEARKAAELAAAKEKLAPVADALKAAARVATVLAGRDEAMRKAARAKVGRQTTLLTKAGPRKGEIAGVSDAGIEIVTKMYANRRVVGESRSMIPWTDLTGKQREEFASGWKPTGPDGEIALAFMALAGKDADAAEAAIARAPGHPLADRLRKRAAVLRVGGAEVAAQEAWSKIGTPAGARRLTAADAKLLAGALDRFQAAHGGTKFAGSKAAEVSALRGRIELMALDAHLVGHWPFDEGRGKSVRDVSGRGNHGTMKTLRWTTGRLGGALEFDGTDEVKVPYSSVFVPGTSDFSASLWLRSDSREGRGVLSLHPGGYHGGKNCWTMGVRGERGTISAGVNDTVNGCRADGRTAVLDGAWHHVALVRKGGEVLLYVDGRLDGSGRAAAPADIREHNPLRIGNRPHVRDSFFVGTMDDVRLYSCALSLSQVRSLANPGGVNGAAGRRPPLTLDLGGGVKLELVYVPPGRFMMGSEAGQADERPVHEVEITRGFYIGKFEVTEAQYQRVMRAAPAESKGPEYPVAQVSWDEAVLFCRRASTVARRRCRLPTEAEWEYACRAGSKGRYGFGDDAGALGDHAWFKYNSGGQTHPVGRKKPNAWGLHDMHGNVWEWCLDWYAPKYIVTGDVTKDPAGPRTGAYRVHRGGSWANADHYCRSARRPRDRVTDRSPEVGFRVVTSVEVR